MRLLRRTDGSPLLQGRWRKVGLVAAALLVAGGWFAWDSTRWPRRETLWPAETKRTRLFEELTAIAGLESQQEGSGREQAKGLIPLLNTGPNADSEYLLVAGTPARWDDVTEILLGGGGSGHWSNISWLRIEATKEGARAVWVRADGWRTSPRDTGFVAEEATLTSGEFLAVVRAAEVLAGATVTTREIMSIQSAFHPVASLRVVGRSGTLLREDSEPYDSSALVRCHAAWAVASNLVRSKSLSRLRPTPTDLEWLHDAYRTMHRRKRDAWRDKCHAVLFRGLGDAEGLEMVIRRSPDLDSHF